MSPAAAIEVLTLGEILAQLSAVMPGPLRHAGALELHAAGAESNVAINLCRLGHPAQWIGVIGDDPFGALVLQAMRAEGVDTTRVRTVPERTALEIIQHDHPIPGKATITYYRQASAGSRLDPDDLDGLDLTRMRLLHITGITPALSASAHAAVERAVECAIRAGVPISMDTNVRRKLWTPADARKLLEPLWNAATVLFTGRGELEWLGLSVEALAAGWLHGHPARYLVEKRGAVGAAVHWHGGLVSQSALDAPAVDRTGAGDALAAGFLGLWLEGAPVERALAAGVACAGLVSTRRGDYEGFPTRTELEHVLAPETFVRR